ncbi:MAG TPA: methionine gamma-lyase family protein, partial [Bacillota bacterium]|nr:methionine gamma-lyase family protein [Bacillota bacterium]
MDIYTEKLLTEKFKIDKKVISTVASSENKIADIFAELDDIMTFNQYKILDAFRKNRISDVHFSWNTGYGYDDPGREALEKVWADVFSAEAALVRPIIVNGTHALSLTLSGILRPGDELIYCTGRPYDTLEETIGIRGSGKGSLKDFGIIYKQVELAEDGSLDFDALKKAITPDTRMISLQRATGYAFRKAVTIPEIKAWTDFV